MMELSPAADDTDNEIFIFMDNTVIAIAYSGLSAQPRPLVLNRSSVMFPSNLLRVYSV